MFSAPIKHSVILLVLATALASCSPGKSEADSLFSNAQALVEQGDPEAAIALLDSLDSAFPSEIELRRKGMHLRAVAREKLTVDLLARTDSVLATLQAEYEGMQGMLRRVDNPIEPYFVAEGFSPAPTGIEARLAPDGTIYLISTLTGHPVHHTLVSASAPGGTAQTARVSHDGERCEWSAGSETVHFVGAECDSIVRFITESSGPVTITWSGETTYSRPLTAGEHAALRAVGRCADVARGIRVATIEHEKLEKQLDMARSQAARTFVDETASEK